MPLGFLELPFAERALSGTWANFSWRPRRPLYFPGQKRQSLIAKEALAILDCRHSERWSKLLDAVTLAEKRFGIENAVSGCGGSCAGTARRLELMALESTYPFRKVAELYPPAEEAVMARDLTLRFFGFSNRFLQVVTCEMTEEDSELASSEFCIYGMLFVKHFWPHALPQLTLHYVDLFLGKDYAGDFLSASSWPLSFWDLILGTEPVTKGTSKRTARLLLSQTGGALSQLVNAPLLRTSVDPQGLGAGGLRHPSWQSLQVAAEMGHISVTVPCVRSDGALKRPKHIQTPPFFLSFFPNSEARGLP
ncbi:unnamed protein product [Durusdinium trenchii]|uniref:Uncharacterized protein n=2 Tax=Durusdinium trenchii TaxID=1381693 RepID=A0ABP0RMI5_9DINO